MFWICLQLLITAALLVSPTGSVSPSAEDYERRNEVLYEILLDEGCHVATDTKSAPKSSLYLHQILYEPLKTQLFDCVRR